MVWFSVLKMDFKLNTSPINEKVKELAEIELRESPEIVEKSIKELRELLAKDQTLVYDLDDWTLMVFLRPCKFYAQSAYDLMKNRAQFFHKLDGIFGDLMFEDVKKPFTEESSINILKNRDHLGRRILILSFGELWNPENMSTDQILQIFFLLQQVAILEPETQVRGFVGILDFNGMGMRQVRALCNPSFSLNLISMVQDNLILRLKEVHIIRQPYIFNIVWQIFKPLLKEKLRNRVFFHGYKLSSLHKFLDPDFLPEDYGGNLTKIDYNGKNWWPITQEYSEHFQKWAKFGLKNQ